jgi:hypothetical protein
MNYFSFYSKFLLKSKSLAYNVVRGVKYFCSIYKLKTISKL